MASLRKDSLKGTALFSHNLPLLLGPAFRLQENLNKRKLWEITIKTTMCTYFKYSDVALWYFFMALNNSIRIVKLNLSWEFLGIAMATSWPWILIILKKHNVIYVMLDAFAGKGAVSVWLRWIPVNILCVLNQAQTFCKKPNLFLDCASQRPDSLVDCMLCFFFEAWMREMTYIVLYPEGLQREKSGMHSKAPRNILGLRFITSCGH